MALKVAFFSDDHGVAFPESYVRILEGNFNTEIVNLLVGVYGSQDARQREKQVEAQAKKLDAIQEQVFKKQAEVNILSEELKAQNMKLTKAQADFETGKLKEPALKKEEDQLKKVGIQFERVNDEAQKLIEAEAIEREKLKLMPVVNPVKVLKFTFPIESKLIEENGLFTLLYNILKDVPMFEGAEDI